MDDSSAPTTTPVQQGAPALATPTSTPSAARARGRNPAVDNDDGSDTVQAVPQPASLEDALAGQPATAPAGTANDAPAWRNEIQALRTETQTLIGELSSTLKQQLTQLQRGMRGRKGKNLYQSSDDSSSSDSPDDSDDEVTPRRDGGSQRPQPPTSGTPARVQLPEQPASESHTAAESQTATARTTNVAQHVPTLRLNKPPTFDGKDCSKFRSWWMSMESYLSLHHATSHTDQFLISYVGTFLEGPAKEWHQERADSLKDRGVPDQWDKFCKDLKRRFTDPAQRDKDANKMMQLKYNGDISAYLTRVRDLNRTLRWSGPMFQSFIKSRIPKKIVEMIYNHRGKIPKDDAEFLKEVKRAGLVYESMLLDSSVAEKEQSGSAKEQSKADRRKEHTSSASSSQPSKKRGQKASAPGSSKDQTWSSVKEALQGVDQADIDKRKKAKVSCWRCGRNTHGTLNCYAKRDVDGKDLPSPSSPPTKAPAVAGVKRKADDTADDSPSDSEKEQPAPKKAAVGAVAFQREESRIFELSDSDSDTETGFH